jgi:hypothetical protein
MKLDPRDLRVETLSDDVVLITFHLIGDGNTGRRALIFNAFPMGGGLSTFTLQTSQRNSVSACESI